MAGKKYESQVGQGKLKFVLGALSFMATIGTLAWIYSTPDSWFLSHNEAFEVKQALKSLETELALLRKQSCGAPPVAGPQGTVKVSTKSPSILPDDDSSNPALAKLLTQIAINKELLVVIATKEVLKTLTILVQSVRRIPITNFLVVALDLETVTFCQQLHVPYYKRLNYVTKLPPGLPSSVNLSTIISGLKFTILRDFLLLGYSVLLSDTDIVYLQNPFVGGFLQRDSDIEVMTDGHDNRTSYGYIDTWDDPPLERCRLVHSTRIWSMNSGQFYLRPTLAAIELLDRVYARLSTDPSLWDQDVFNEELMYVSRPGYSQLLISKRILDYLLFMNSKMLFSVVRKELDEGGKFAKLRPVSIHINYHRRKVERMQGVVEYFVHGNKDALSPFTEGDP